MDKYIELIKIGIKKILSYRGLITLIIIKNYIYIFLQYSLWNSIKENSIVNVNLTNILIYFIIIKGLDSTNFDLSQTISHDVKNGDIVNILAKPIEIEKYYFFDILGGTIAKVIAILFPNILISLILTRNFEILFILKIFFIIIGSYLLNFVIELIFGTLSFFTQNIWGIESLKLVFILMLSGSFFPIEYYPLWLIKIIDYTPFVYIYGKVAEFMIYKNDFVKILFFQIFFTLSLFYIYKLILKVCLKKISINGG
ncbi:ABC-2 family transporter protein [Streptobacillus moniliformis]|uniref:ABC-2 type transporter n=1 Tax=Streptobacillus moniliformis (strain ATCC 14647 / DSM 12112 / NCTC 10651 / 9901) TaxID=519441 RepID=D1AWF4_STRM9|nr:ABC-2 family transporter protein [Streptobacillus moniliformis]ACZ00630.1 protein of unknown function DUF990 [Streptobacillus moniliformis DSM 12112]AVL42959.1 ABC transporter permease [Streptobacillus moniliformis]QXW65396.1 ABC-2 family transporter protein [Streptobacillus moniliformis]SQA14244.1 ABC-type uncharacterized transport system, permease component [Streptobacillus moniliformis]